MKRIFFYFILSLFFGPLCGRSLELASFHAGITVQKTGEITVEEVIQPRFTGKWNGIYRLIPIRYRTPRNPDFHLDLELISINDAEGRALRYESSRERHYRKFQIWVPNAEDSVRTVVLRYQVNNGLQFFETYDELYWNVTGDESEIPISQASAVVQLPQQVAGVRATAFTGHYGSTLQEASVVVEENRVSVATREPLGIHEGLTLAVAWDPGVVQRPGVLEQTVDWIYRLWPLALPILAFIIMYWLWKSRGRDPRLKSIATRYEPPEQLSPAEVGTLVDNYPHARDLTATLVDLAVRGYLRIEETQDEKFLGLWTEKGYIFHRSQNSSSWDSLKPHERKFMAALFDSKSSVSLSDLKNRFYKHLPELRDEIYAQLLDQRFYLRRPDKIRSFYVLLAAICGAVLMAFTLFVSPVTFPLFPPILGGILATLIVFAFGWIMPARTREGTRRLEEILGFEEFMERVESERYRRMITGPEMFERYLPYALALGVERNWADAFRDIYREPPDWYQGQDWTSFNPTRFVSSIERLSTATAGALTSSPRQSGGSAFGGSSGGGGFSGGGFGGGSTGGF